MTLFSQIVRFMLCASLFSLAACQTPNPTQTSLSPQSRQLTQSKFEPYTGPVSLSIDTGMTFQRAGKVVPIAGAQSFQIQNLDDADIVFEETFQQDSRKDELYREIDIEDAAQHYTLEVTKNDVKGNAGKVQVNINGTNWIKEKDFSNKENTVTHTSVTLLPKSVMRIRIQGNKNLSVTVRLIAEGSSNTVLPRRRGKLERKQVTQAIHDRRNDQNIFDPSDPDSLGQLEPYEGDLVSEDPSAPIVGQVRTNGVDTKIQVGYLTAYVNEPVAANLATLQNRFPVEVVSQQEILGDTMASLKVRFEDVDLSTLVSQWQALNQRTDRFAIPTASFSSANTAKTIAALASIYIEQGDLLKDIGFVNILEKHGVSPAPIVAQEESFPDNDGLWWLKSTRTNEAWNYSLGSGATVAILDSDFGKNVYDYTPDISKGRILTSPVAFNGLEGFLNRYLDLYNKLYPECSLNTFPRDPDCPNDYNNNSGHGADVMSLLGAGLNNDTGIVGAAPRVKMLPLNINNGTATSLQLQLSQLLEIVKTQQIKIDVINLSLGYNVSPLGVYFASLDNVINLKVKVPIGLGGIEVEIDPLEMLALEYLDAESKKVVEIISELVDEHGITVVASAGNSDSPTKATDIFSEQKIVNFPSSIYSVISVGGYDKNKQRAMFPILNGGSNYSSQVTIWAPGTGLKTTSYDRHDITALDDWSETNHSPEGTSHAAPQVAGVVALMRSANPNLTPWEIRQILQKTADAPPDPSSFLVPGETYPVYMLNALKAMQHPKVGAKPAETYNLRVASQDYLVDYEHRIPVDNPIPDVNPSNLFVELFENDLADYPGIKEGDCVKVTGWTHEQSPGVPYAKIKPLTLEKDDNPPAGCKQSFRTLSLSTDDNAPTQENPFTTQSITFPESTSYIKVTLSGDSQGQKLFLRHKNLDSHSIAAASISSTPEQHESQANKVALGTDFTEVGTLSETHTVIIAVTNNGDSSDFYTVEMALAPDDNRRVVVQSTSSFSMGSMEPVQVLLKIKDSNGNPANGNYFVGLDRNAGSFKVLAPVAGEGIYSSSGTFVRVENGTVLLEYLPRGVTRDYGTQYCGGTTCKNISARFQVSGCDYSYYGTQRCPIIGPDATGPYADEGRVYTTWINGWGEPYVLNLTANGQTHDVEFTGLTDSAGRVVPDGFTLYVTNPYYGSITRLDGTGSGVWTPIAVQNGALRFRYTSVKADHCWPFSPSLVDEVHFDDSRFRESWTAPALRATYLRASDCN